MIALGIKSGREGKHVRGTKLHAEATGLTVLDNDGNVSFCHENPTPGGISTHENFGHYDVLERDCL
jgi:hypothetical protein